MMGFNMTRNEGFYFLHIPKTAGRFFTHNVVVPLESILIDNNVHSFYNRDTYIAHQFWSKEITNNTYVTSLIRNPVKHFVSVYSHYAMLNNQAQRAVPVGLEEYNKNTMFDWMDTYYEYVSNIQSKNFLITDPGESFIYSDATKDCKVSNEIIFNRLKEVSLLIRSEDLKTNNIPKIHNKILTDLGIEYKKIDHKLQRASNYWNPDSTRIYNSLTNTDITKILDFNSIDSEVYNTKSLFYSLEKE
jgi:hypothetical protein